MMVGRLTSARLLERANIPSDATFLDQDQRSWIKYYEQIY